MGDDIPGLVAEAKSMNALVEKVTVHEWREPLRELALPSVGNSPRMGTEAVARHPSRGVGVEEGANAVLSLGENQFSHLCQQ